MGATPVRSIRLKCLDCSCGQPKEVRLCPVETCALWSYRMGFRPRHPRTLQANIDARREKLRAALEISAPESPSADNDAEIDSGVVEAAL